MHRYIDEPAELLESARDLEGAPRVFLDTEFESRKNRCELCLLQVSRGDQVYVIDALRLGELSPLGTALDPSRTQWVVHAGRQDVSLVMEALGATLKPRVFDTQVAWGLLSAESSVSLAYLEYRLLGRRPHKSRQADNWQRRPLDRVQLTYAASDVELLPALVEHLEARLEEYGRSDLVFSASRDQLWPQPSAPMPLGLETFRNAWQLDSQSQAVLLALVDWYNSLDRASHRGGPDPRSLLSVAAHLPQTPKQLRAIKGIPKRWGAQFAHTMVEIVSTALRHSDAHQYVQLTPPSYKTFDSYRLDAWLQMMRAEVCAELVVAPDLVLPGRLLSRIGDALRRGVPPVPGLQGWRAELLNEPIARYIRHHPPPRTPVVRGAQSGAPAQADH